MATYLIDENGKWEIQEGKLGMVLIEPSQRYLDSFAADKAKRQREEHEARIKAEVERVLAAGVRAGVIKDMKDRGDLPQDFKDSR